MIIEMSNDINQGLSAGNKYIPSKYFYDKIGDEIFVEIMNMPEYYLTNAEHEIFKQKAHEIIQSFKVSKEQHFELIELGSGDGTKTRELIKVLLDESYNFTYIPIDISDNSLFHLSKKLQQEFPRLNVQTLQGDYFEILDQLKNDHCKKVALFLGSNLGNLDDNEARNFIQKFNSVINKNDLLLLGLDLIKPEDIVLPAYSDTKGITKRFNLNLLERINRELHANFDISSFTHKAEYSEEEGIARSFLVSNKQQSVQIDKLNKTFNFELGEPIYTEMSRKYNDTILNSLLTKTDLKITNKFLDKKELFADYIIEKQS